MCCFKNYYFLWRFLFFSHSVGLPANWDGVWWRCTPTGAKIDLFHNFLFDFHAKREPAIVFDIGIWIQFPAPANLWLTYARAPLYSSFLSWFDFKIRSFYSVLLVRKAARQGWWWWRHFFLNRRWWYPTTEWATILLSDRKGFYRLEKQK